MSFLKDFKEDLSQAVNELVTEDEMMEEKEEFDDMDDEMVTIARANARLAGVEQLIHFQRRGVEQLSHPKKYGFIITNPPYGERLEDKKNLAGLYGTIGERYRMLDSWSMYLITSYEKAEQAIGRKADKNRKLYNGMMKTYYYQFLGAKPGKRNRQGK